MINPLIFREYDIRGIAEKDLTDENIKLIVKAISSIYRDNGVSEIVVGRDGRISSPRIYKILVETFLNSGIDVIDTGVVASPVFYFACHRWGKNGGVMITGSHNPPEYNGIKISLNGSTIYGDAIKEIYRRIEKGDFPQGKGKFQERDIVEEYRNFIKQDIKIKRKMKIVIDSGNGVGGGIIIPALRDLGVEVISLYEEVDGNFPNHFPDPTVPENLKALIEKVKTEQAEFGVAFDGDADRIGVVDEKGQIIWGDRLMSIFSKFLLRENPGGKIVFEVKCSKALPEVIEKYGGVPIMSRTGHSPIEARIKEENALFGGEMSGHIYFNDRYFGYDDALYTAARLCELVSSSDKKVSEYLEDVPSYPITPEIRIECPDEIKFKVVEKLIEEFKKKYEVITIDGARIIYPDGWGLVRASNTQPVLVLRFEANTQEGVQRIKDEVETTLNKKLSEFK